MKTYTAVAGGVLLGLLSATGAQASTYYLNLSNMAAYSNPEPYIKVDISQPTAQQIQFTVTPEQSVIPNALLMGFGFNTTGTSIALSQISFTSGEPGWTVAGSGQDDGFGNFQYNLSGTANKYRLSALTFDINLTQSQVSGGVSASDFVQNSTKNTAEPAVPFVAHVANLNGNTGYFGGPAPVPVPPAVWLFGSGLVGLVGIARRRPKS